MISINTQNPIEKSRNYYIKTLRSQQITLSWRLCLRPKSLIVVIVICRSMLFFFIFLISRSTRRVERKFIHTYSARREDRQIVCWMLNNNTTFKFTRFSRSARPTSRNFPSTLILSLDHRRISIR